MVHYSCDTVDKLPLTHLKMAEAISNGPIRRERVLSIGRPDGIIAAAHKANNPHLKRFVAYVQQTKEELRKCSWPTWDELKGSTVVVFIAIGILGGFTVLVDQLFFRVFYLFKL